jgi:hypothetical protein
MEVRKMTKTKEKLERPLKSFIFPNESFKWDFVLEQYADEGAGPEGTPQRLRVQQKTCSAFLE